MHNTVLTVAVIKNVHAQTNLIPEFRGFFITLEKSKNYVYIYQCYERIYLTLS